MDINWSETVQVYVNLPIQ